MGLRVIERDSDLRFPHFTVLKASAGSGKTHMLTKRFVQFLLSEKISRNSLRNILAITFSNNAAREMKEKIIEWLKLLHFGDPEKTEQMLEAVTMDRDRLAELSGQMVAQILRDYADFEVRTIDSFMTSIFKTSAIDFGFNTEFDILMNNDSLMAYSFDLFLRNVREGTKEAELLLNIIATIQEGKQGQEAYLWDPSSALLEEVKDLYGKLSATGKVPVIEDYSAAFCDIKNEIRTSIEGLEKAVLKSGLAKRGNSSFGAVLALVREGRFADLIGKGLKNPPVNKPEKGQSDLQPSFDRIVGEWETAAGLINKYIALHVRSRSMPYLKVYESFKEIVESVKRRQGKVFIGDINRNLAEYLSREIVPDIYFRIGETIYHFLIDEFQDTSQIQWDNLFPLLENALSQNGSLFVVGDTKQAIYGFRNADYTIMRKYERTNPFPSAAHDVRELETSRRSPKKVLDFNEKVFKEIVAGNDKYMAAGTRSGLTDYVQCAGDGSSRGYCEVMLRERDDEIIPERHVIQDLVAELVSRGFSYGDIAILTRRNEDVVRTTLWLNEKNIAFIAYSNLDIRRRKITGEIVALLNFLDSPMDDLSFSAFINGEIFGALLRGEHPEITPERLGEFLFEYRQGPPLYKSFQKEFPQLWERYFDGLFKASGYFPIYDLVTEAYAVFRVFETLGDEEAALVKVLEAVKEFEGAGYNSIRDFLDFAGDSKSGESEWNMDVPKALNAVKVMTIHKAKGLGFPAVIVLLYEGRNRGFDYIIEEEENGVRLLKINRKTMVSDPAFERLYEEEATKENVNRLNSLYVGFTRAKEELYVIGVKGRGETFPFDLLPASDFAATVKPERFDIPAAKSSEVFSVRHHPKKIDVEVRKDEMISLEERARGEFIHRVLCHIEFLRDDMGSVLEDIIRRVTAETGSAPERVKELLLRLFERREIATYFEPRPGRAVKREQEFSDEEGHLFRMDRVVIDQDSVTILDFKTGGEGRDGEKHRTQMRTYMKIAKDIYPGRRVEGMIVYIDLGEIRSL
ncbi:MAG TPA: UvrD-helicase domain-containing protein [Thermodesulfovibrionales bacterium]|nr:UvrD-helicase domain-containing protein [Thermodesulfovibrionales bacterium]